MTTSIDQIREAMLASSDERKKDMRPRDDRGRLISKAKLAELTATDDDAPGDVLTDEELMPAPSTFEPVRVWTAGPGMKQDRIYAGNVYAPLAPLHDGAYYVTNQHDFNVLKRALGAQFWLDTIPESEPSVKCDTCGWTTRSYPALVHHANHAHGRPQSA